MMHDSGDANKVSIQLKAEELLLATNSNLGYDYVYFRKS